jgi:hypothetical protein
MFSHRWVVGCLAVVVATALAFFALTIDKNHWLLVRDIREYPMTVALSKVGYFGQGASWSLNVNSAGEARLTIDTLPPVVRSFKITSEQMEHVRQVVDQERFFELGDEMWLTAVPTRSRSRLAREQRPYGFVS